MILQGHVLDRLRELPDCSVHCVVTSPPYWGLRAYGTEPQIWGGSKECAHDWESHVQPAANGITHSEGMTGATLSGSSATRKPRESAFCAVCGAWRGELGLEPTPELFIAHMVEIFEEVRRVLRKDGTCWVNMGDTYSASGAAGNRDGKQGTNKGSHDKPNQDQRGSRQVEAFSALLSNG